jgi:predicted esterase
MRPFTVPLAALALIAATSNAQAQPAPAAPQAHAGLFDYAAGSTTCSRPPNGAQTGATLAIGGPGAPPTNAVVLTPSGHLANAPVVLWVHWLGAVATTNHTEFESEALELTKHGVVSMLVDMPWSQKDWFNSGRTTDGDYAATIAQVVALRRALDCLIAVPGVDKSRIAYVGHDFGAMVGALLLAVDGRPSCAVLMAPTLSFWEWYLLGKQPADPAAYVARMSVFDLPGWLSKGKQKATLLQVGQLDEYVSQATGIAIRNAIPERGRTLRAYKLDHALDDETTRDDRRAWLLAQLTSS